MLLAAIIWENLDKRSWIENGQRFAIHLLTFYAVFFFYDLSSLDNFEIFLFLSADENSDIDIGAI